MRDRAYDNRMRFLDGRAAGRAGLIVSWRTSMYQRPKDISGRKSPYNETAHIAELIKLIKSELIIYLKATHMTRQRISEHVNALTFWSLRQLL